MKLLKFSFDHLRMFKKGIFELDLFAEDRVPKEDESVTHLFKTFYTNNTIAFAGINASGKTMSLALTDFALDIISGIPVNNPYNTDYFIDLFDGETMFRGLVWAEETLFLLETLIKVQDASINVSKTGKNFAIEDEKIFVIPNSISRNDLKNDLKLLTKQGKEIASRSKEDERIRRLLGNDRSMIISFVGSSPLSMRLKADEKRYMPQQIEDAADILRVFDSSIQSLTKNEGSDSFELVIEGRDEPLILSPLQINNVLSSGTLKGCEITQYVLEAIKSGTYILIDEIENHLNKMLVKMIIELFSNKETNPRGATLIFTTHYPEILDCIHRKDCVYFFIRDKEGKISKVKYSHKVERIENKKSEVFVSNYIKGTAPKYAEVALLRNLAKEVAYGSE